MHIYIPSRKRHNQLHTLERMSPEWRKKSTLFVHEDEVRSYVHAVNDKGYSCRVIGHRENGMEHIRKQIGRTAQDDGNSHFFMLDDDFKFYRRADDTSVALVKQSRDDFNRMMEEWNYLHEFQHIKVTGISFRSGNNHEGPASPKTYRSDTRIHGAMGFDTKLFNSAPIFDIPMMEDFATILWFLCLGYENAKLTHYAMDQVMTNAPGGCADTRTQEVQKRSAETLHAFYPEYVTIVEKANKTGGDFGTRTDVRIAWAKAAAAGRKVHPYKRTYVFAQ